MLESDKSLKIVQIKVDEIRDDFEKWYKDQSGKGNTYESELEVVEDMMKDIAKNGLKEPIGLHYRKIRNTNLYRVEDGVHRLRACKNLGWKEISCVIRPKRAGPHP
jgi:ParB-like chromosome segregation protein Spo0J